MVLGILRHKAFDHQHQGFSYHASLQLAVVLAGGTALEWSSSLRQLTCSALLLTSCSLTYLVLLS